MTTGIQNIPVNYINFEFTPTEGADVDSVRRGEVGDVLSVTHQGNEVTITTTKGTFKGDWRPELPPPRGVGVNDYSNAYDSLGGIQNGTIDMGAVMALFHEIATEMKKGAREERMTQMHSQVADLEKQAQKIRDGAMKTMIAGVVMGSAGVVAGAISIAGSVKAANATTSGKAGQVDAKMQLKTAQTNVTKSTNQVAATRAAVTKAETDVNVQQTKVNNLKTEQTKLDASLKDARAEVKVKEANLAEAKAKLDTATKSGNLGEGEMNQLKADVDTAEKALQTAKQQAVNAEIKSTSHQKQLDGAEADLKAKQSTLKQEVQKLDRATQKLEKDMEHLEKVSKKISKDETLTPEEKQELENETMADIRQQKADAEMEIQRSQQLLGKYQGISQAVQSSGQIGQSVAGYYAGLDQEEGKRAEAASVRSGALFQDAVEEDKSIQELMADIRQKLAAMIQAERDIARSIHAI